MHKVLCKPLWYNGVANAGLEYIYIPYRKFSSSGKWEASVVCQDSTGEAGTEGEALRLYGATEPKHRFRSRLQDLESGEGLTIQQTFYRC